jgi:uncharacterized protein YbjT (DUF2867 family)
MTDFAGRKILVPGATGGIGGATVDHLNIQGADVIAGTGQWRNSNSWRSRPACAPLSTAS